MFQDDDLQMIDEMIELEKIYQRELNEVAKHTRAQYAKDMVLLLRGLEELAKTGSVSRASLEAIKSGTATLEHRLRHVPFNIVKVLKQILGLLEGKDRGPRARPA